MSTFSLVGTVLVDEQARHIRISNPPQNNPFRRVARNREETARRIVASWYACLPMPREAVEQLSIDKTLDGLLALTRSLGDQCDELTKVLREYVEADARYSDLHEGVDGAEQKRIMDAWQAARENAERLLGQHGESQCKQTA